MKKSTKIAVVKNAKLNKESLTKVTVGFSAVDPSTCLKKLTTNSEVVFE